MSLQDMPRELFLQISSYLNEVDRQCLRITCRGFRQLVLPPPKCITTDPYFRSSAYSSNLNSELLRFLYRLFRPGNVFAPYGHDVAICVKCIQIQPMSRFPMTELRVDGGMICKLCISWVLREVMPAGHRHTWSNVHTYSCATCGSRGDSNVMHEHNMHPGKVNKDRNKRLCKACHLRKCSDPGCKGWPEGFVERHQRHFYTECDSCGDHHNPRVDCWTTYRTNTRNDSVSQWLGGVCDHAYIAMPKSVEGTAPTAERMSARQKKRITPSKNCDEDGDLEMTDRTPMISHDHCSD